MVRKFLSVLLTLCMVLSCMAVSVSAVLLQDEYTTVAEDSISLKDYTNAATSDTTSIAAALTKNEGGSAKLAGSGWKWNWSTAKDTENVPSTSSYLVKKFGSGSTAYNSIKMMTGTLYRQLSTPISFTGKNGAVQVKFSVSDGTTSATNRDTSNAEIIISDTISAGYDWCLVDGSVYKEGDTANQKREYTKPYIKVGGTKKYSNEIISTTGAWNSPFIDYTLNIEFFKDGNSKASLTATTTDSTVTVNKTASVESENLNLTGIDYIGLRSTKTARFKGISIGTKDEITPVPISKDNFADYATSSTAPTASLGTGFLSDWNFKSGSTIVYSSTARVNVLRTMQCYSSPLTRTIQGEIDFSADGEYFVKVTAANLATSENGKKAHNIQFKLGDNLAFGSKADADGTAHYPTITINGSETTGTQALDLTKYYDYYLHIITSATADDKIEFAVSEYGIMPSMDSYSINSANLSDKVSNIAIANGQNATCGIASVEINMFNAALENHEGLKAVKTSLESAENYKDALDKMSGIADGCAKEYLKRAAAEQFKVVRIVDYTLDAGSVTEKLTDIADSAGQSVRCVYRYENTTNSTQTVKRCMIIYVDGKLAECIYSPISVAANSTSGYNYVGFYKDATITSIPSGLDMSKVQIKLYSFFGNGMTAYEDAVVLPNSQYTGN